MNAEDTTTPATPLTADVIITGAGLAGLTLARQILLYTTKTVILLDKQLNPPGKSQKVGESLVQLAGYYLYRTLDLEEHLLTKHFLKYNLRFHWKTTGGKHDYWKDISTAAIRTISNIATFQLDRNLLEEHLMEINKADPRFTFIGGAKNIKVELSPDGGRPGKGLHQVRWASGEATAPWVVDASGRPGILKRSLGLEKKNSIRHGSTWAWVEGLVNYEKFTEASHKEIINHPKRQEFGNFPFFLGTSHFCGEGRWFWVIPLHGKTSLGLVYDHAVINPEEVSNGRKMLDWVAKDWPIFAEDFKNRKILDEGRFVDYSYDARQTIDASGWALTGEAGRFSDPLYSPGSDLIAIYNTLIIDAMETPEGGDLEAKCAFYEQIMRVMYEAYVPSYQLSYNCLGDQETLTLKYTWELAIYFGFYVLPFVNQLFTNRQFMIAYLKRFAIFGPINRTVQNVLHDFFEWKKERNLIGLAEPLHVEFYSMEPLRMSEKLFYEVGLTPEEAEDRIDTHVERLREFARYILAQVYASVLGDRKILTNAPFINSLKVRDAKFEPEKMAEQYAKYKDSQEMYMWNLNPFVLESFVPCNKMGVEPEMKAMEENVA